MFIEKARQLERTHAMGGIVIDRNLSFESTNIGMFSMNGDGNDNVHIPLVLMFKDQAMQLTDLLAQQQTNFILYIGDEKYFQESFYQQFDHLQSLIEPNKQTSKRWFYGQIERFYQQCTIVPERLRSFERIVHQHVEISKYFRLSGQKRTKENVRIYQTEADDVTP